MTSRVETHAPELDTQLRNRAWKDSALYAGARIVLFAALTALIKGAAVLIDSPVPWLICALLALLVAFPLSLLLFSSLRMRVTSEMAQWDEQRKAHKKWVQEELARR
ncbi:hypothetical protein CCICO_10515 [Corynebacterium ciconiae DSM 44920]|uniref:DUF4229 domain-containing protein n=1 Tax=Corynebacterium ciconiae TaxID=227319 RepID=UPI00058BFAE6|nr:DUF4229 domain-containing protein [Corynebacterium ciconiae]WKD62102.1 hypothetical protein CCICO_10515 [Corynebacterium ciconiae DSM 44920]